MRTDFFLKGKINNLLLFQTVPLVSYILDLCTYEIGGIIKDYQPMSNFTWQLKFTISGNLENMWHLPA